MQVIPAIDLRGGRVVRLRQGDFERQRSYGDDPLRVARHWVGAGAERLHLVDLDGASAGLPAQLGWLGPIIQGAGVPCQVGGGLRDLEAARATLAAGADRVVLGTVLLGGGPAVRTLVEALGSDAFVAAIDIRDGNAMGEAWRQDAPGVPYEAVLERLLAAGVRRFAITAIDRDGMLGGPDFDLLRDARVRLGGAHLIAAGGVTSLADVAALTSMGCEAAIVGRSLYEGRLDLAEAIKLAAAA
jgi:phosphoribosylformimino-5-aminoimidazole carboxamide ribotide isomerase